MHVQKIIIGKRSWRDTSKNDGSIPEKAGGCVDLYGSRTPELTSRHRVVDAEPAGLEEEHRQGGLGGAHIRSFFPGASALTSRRRMEWRDVDVDAYAFKPPCTLSVRLDHGVPHLKLEPPLPPFVNPA